MPPSTCRVAFSTLRSTVSGQVPARALTGPPCSRCSEPELAVRRTGVPPLLPSNVRLIGASVLSAVQISEVMSTASAGPPPCQARWPPSTRTRLISTRWLPPPVLEEPPDRTCRSGVNRQFGVPSAVRSSRMSGSCKASEETTASPASSGSRATRAERLFAVSICGARAARQVGQCHVVHLEARREAEPQVRAAGNGQVRARWNGAPRPAVSALRRFGSSAAEATTMPATPTMAMAATARMSGLNGLRRGRIGGIRGF